jgi:hypothetical protein
MVLKETYEHEEEIKENYCIMNLVICSYKKILTGGGGVGTNGVMWDRIEINRSFGTQT